MLKPNGKLLIVLPEGIFSNSSSKTRSFILKNFIVETIVKLPKHAFVMSGVDTINTVILIARKNDETRKNYIKINDESTWINKKHRVSINFALVNQIGYEPSGKQILKGYEDSDLKIISKKIINEEYDTIIMDPFEYSNLEFSNEDKNESWKKSLVKFVRVDFENVPIRLDPTYYFFKEETKEILKNFKTLNIKTENIKKVKLTEQELNEDVEKIYKYISVVKTMSGEISEVNERTVDEILSSKKESWPQKVFYGDIVFNPYRVNTGSIIFVNSKESNLVTSPAYVVLRKSEINPNYLVQLLKTPFMKYQIQVLASGSVRDNFSQNQLKELKVPNFSIEEQNFKYSEVFGIINEINRLNEKIIVNSHEIDKILNNF